MKQQRFEFPFRLMIRPFSCFWDMKYEGKGTVRDAFIIVVLLVLAMILNRQFAGFLVNYYDPQLMNSLNEVRYVIVPLLLWCVSNWSITTLMDGEGKFREIFMVASYSTLPIILVLIPFTLISNFMTEEETVFYWLFIIISIVWFVWLLFVGTMTIHQYSASKTIATMFLTLIVMMIIIFLGMLMFSLLQQAFGFVYNVYREIIFRL